jgi:alginate O-acetyltransferase complex protein AlgI
MAIGLGRMFGFRFPENFRWPYVADSVQEFWRRWHISLSTWFRDYLYVPLGGNRVPRAAVYRNLVVVFFLCGLWHGASWNFVVWGVFHGAFLVIERLGLAAALRHRAAVLRHAYLLAVVMVGWVFFRADTLSSALGFLGAMAGLNAAAISPFTVQWYLTPEVTLALAAGVVGSTPVVPALRGSLDNVRALPSRTALDLISTTALMAILFASILQIAARSYNPFIYFRF